MNNRNILLGLSSLCLVLVGYIIWNENNQLKTAYINNAKLYTEFALAKELSTKLEQVQQIRKGIIDSLGLELKRLELQLEKEPKAEGTQSVYEKKLVEFRIKQQQFIEDNQVLNQQYQQEVSTQLNQYLEDFTTKEGYDYIYGATGTGSLMGAAEKYDITEPVLHYVNQRYQGYSK